MKITLIQAPNPDVCAMAAAICTNAKDQQKALKSALKSGHESVLEHAVCTFKVEGVSRALLAQLTRHRIASFSVVSQRYVDMIDAKFVIPDAIMKDTAAYREFTFMLGEIKRAYEFFVGRGIPKEDARFVLPNATTTDLIMTMNLRELRHFFSLRCCNRAQWEIRELADKMLAICKEQAPDIFANAGAGCVRGQCPEANPCGKPKGGGQP